MSRILAVQEKSKNVFDIEKSLSSHEVLIVDSFSQAMNRLQSGTFDLIICAVHLHDGSVYDLLKYVKREPRHRTTPFVFFCNEPSEIAQFVSDSTEATAKLLGADKFITSYAFNADSFRKEIESLLNAPETLDEHQQFVARERERARVAIATGNAAAAEKILQDLLEHMHTDADAYQLLDVATVQHDLTKMLEAQGKMDEAQQSRQLIEDF